MLDIVPTAEVWARADDRFAVIYWHWGFLAQPAPLPERLIGSDPEAFFEHHVRRMGIGGGDSSRYPSEVVDVYRRQLRDAGAVQAICEDYRAGASIDRRLDEADRGQPIEVPLRALWGARGALPLFYDDIEAIWRDWATDVSGGAVDAGHFLAEDRPEQVTARLAEFLG